jgi:hypothetical protein
MDSYRYMIRNGEGLYSKGGYSPTYFVKPESGKVWATIGALKNHLNLIMEQGGGIPDDWMVERVHLQCIPECNAKVLYEEHYLNRKRREAVDDKRRRKEYLIEQKQKIDEELKQL